MGKAVEVIATVIETDRLQSDQIYVGFHGGGDLLGGVALMGVFQKLFVLQKKLGGEEVCLVFLRNGHVVEHGFLHQTSLRQGAVKLIVSDLMGADDAVGMGVVIGIEDDKAIALDHAV